MSALVALDPGPFTTLQDEGRFGWQRYGVAVSGAMDIPSLHIANALVGNLPGEAALEFTLLGGTWRCEAESVRVAVAGGTFAVRAGERTVAPWRSFTLRRGETLSIGAAPDAARGYVAAAGGFSALPELGSVSVHLRSGIGGAPLARGAAVALRRDAAFDGPERALDADLAWRRGGLVRVLPGPQDDYFDAAAMAAFLGGEYRVTQEADRMGLRLEGPRIAHARGFNIVSDGIANGSVQVPGSGQPIVLLNDRQTTGGYPKIATAITADLPTLGQLRPGDRLRFAVVTLEEARAALAAADAALRNALAAIVAAAAGDLGSERLLALNLVGGVTDAKEDAP